MTCPRSLAEVHRLAYLDVIYKCCLWKRWRSTEYDVSLVVIKLQFGFYHPGNNVPTIMFHDPDLSLQP